MQTAHGRLTPPLITYTQHLSHKAYITNVSGADENGVEVALMDASATPKDIAGRSRAKTLMADMNGDGKAADASEILKIIVVLA